MGWAFRPAGVHYRWPVRLFIMRSMGEMLFLEPVTGSFAVYAHRYMSPFFGYLTGVVLLVYVDGGGDLRDHRHRGLRAVLVPGDGPVDTRR